MLVLPGSGTRQVPQQGAAGRRHHHDDRHQQEKPGVAARRGVPDRRAAAQAQPRQADTEQSGHGAGDDRGEERRQPWVWGLDRLDRRRLRCAGDIRGLDKLDRRGLGPARGLGGLDGSTGDGCDVRVTSGVSTSSTGGGWGPRVGLGVSTGSTGDGCDVRVTSGVSTSSTGGGWGPRVGLGVSTGSTGDGCGVRVTSGSRQARPAGVGVRAWAWGSRRARPASLRLPDALARAPEEGGQLERRLIAVLVLLGHRASLPPDGSVVSCPAASSGSARQ